MKGKDYKIFLEALDELENKGISKKIIFETIENAMLAAYKKNYGDSENARVEINKTNMDVKIYNVKKVMEDDDIEDDEFEIAIEEAQKIDKKAQIGDEIRFEVNCEEFRRNAIQNAKQIVIQKVREAERENIFQNFKTKEDTIINGIIRRIDERGNVFIEFNSIEAVLSVSEQSLSDVYRVGERIKVYVVQVEQTSKFPKILISRKSEGFLKKLFETEIPEIDNGTIEIKAISREAGSRAKVAVYSNNTDVDTIGACIGQKGLRIKNIVDELNGEKIDIVEWKEDKSEFVSKALSPSKVLKVEMSEDETTAKVLVPADQLSLAIGKNGQNARLAARLTNVRVDIKTAEEVK